MSKITHSGNLIIIGFIISALSMIFLVYKSTQVNFDMSTKEDPYSMEIEFNEQLNAEAFAKQLGNAFSIASDSEYVVITIPADVSRKITKGTVEFYCYSNSQMDRMTGISSSNDGVYVFPRETYLVGNNYNVKVSFTAGGKHYFKEMKVF